MIELLNVDCMDYMRDLPDKCFDLAIVDPPYGIGEDGSKNKTRGYLAKAKDYKGYAGNDKEPPSNEYFEHLQRISKELIVFGANHFISKIPLDSSCWIVWDKNNSGDFADCELALTTFKTAVRKFKFTWNGMIQENMKNKEERMHPNQKPVALYNWLYHNYAKPGQRVLDTHLGSGSNAIAAHYFGVDFVGCELDSYYYQAACQRFKLASAQTTLFDNA